MRAAGLTLLQEFAMSTANGKSRSGFFRQAAFVATGVAALVVVAWTVTSVVAQPRVLAKYRADYEDAKFAREHPTLTRIFSNEQAAQAGEVFARDYEALEDAGLVMAPIRSVSVTMSHDKYRELVKPTEREQFEKERAEREKRQREEDAERLKEIQDQERKDLENKQ